MNSSINCDKFRNFRSKRYIKPTTPSFSLDATYKKQIINLKNHNSHVNQQDPFKNGQYHLITPKRLTSQMVNISQNKISARPQVPIINASRVCSSFEKIDYSKVSTQDTITQSILINRSNAQNSSKFCNSRRSQSENIEKLSQIQKSFIEKNQKNEVLIQKIKKVFMKFRGKQEDILRKFNDSRRKRMKVIFPSPKIFDL